MGPSRTIKLENGQEIQVSTEQILETYVQKTKRELQREDSIHRTREALRPLIENIGIDDLAMVISESVVQSEDQQTETLAEHLKDILSRLDEPLSVEDQKLLEQYKSLSALVRELNQTTKANKPLKAVEILNTVKTDVDLKKIEETLSNLLQITQDTDPKDVNVTNWGPIKEILSSLVDKQLTDPENPSDYLNVRLSDGRVFYRPSGGGGGTSKLPFKQNGQDAQVVLTPDGKVPVEITSEVNIVNTGPTNPSTGVTGQVFYNTTDGLLYIYLGGSWVVIGTGEPVVTTGSHLLLEDGSRLLLENGDSLLLED